MSGYAIVLEGIKFQAQMAGAIKRMGHHLPLARETIQQILENAPIILFDGIPKAALPVLRQTLEYYAKVGVRYSLTAAVQADTMRVEWPATVSYQVLMAGIPGSSGSLRPTREPGPLPSPVPPPSSGGDPLRTVVSKHGHGICPDCGGTFQLQVPKALAASLRVSLPAQAMAGAASQLPVALMAKDESTICPGCGERLGVGFPAEFQGAQAPVSSPSALSPSGPSASDGVIDSLLDGGEDLDDLDEVAPVGVRAQVLAPQVALPLPLAPEDPASQRLITDDLRLVGEPSPEGEDEDMDFSVNIVDLSGLGDLSDISDEDLHALDADFSDLDALAGDFSGLAKIPARPTPPPEPHARIVPRSPAPRPSSPPAATQPPAPAAPPTLFAPPVMATLEVEDDDEFETDEGQDLAPPSLEHEEEDTVPEPAPPSLELADDLPPPSLEVEDDEDTDQLLPPALDVDTPEDAEAPSAIAPSRREEGLGGPESLAFDEREVRTEADLNDADAEIEVETESDSEADVEIEVEAEVEAEVEVEVESESDHDGDVEVEVEAAAPDLDLDRAVETESEPDALVEVDVHDVEIDDDADEDEALVELDVDAVLNTAEAIGGSSGNGARFELGGYNYDEYVIRLSDFENFRRRNGSVKPAQAPRLEQLEPWTGPTSGYRGPLREPKSPLLNIRDGQEIAFDGPGGAIREVERKSPPKPPPAEDSLPSWTGRARDYEVKKDEEDPPKPAPAPAAPPAAAPQAPVKPAPSAPAPPKKAAPAPTRLASPPKKAAPAPTRLVSPPKKAAPAPTRLASPPKKAAPAPSRPTEAPKSPAAAARRKTPPLPPPAASTPDDLDFENLEIEDGALTEEEVPAPPPSKAKTPPPPSKKGRSAIAAKGRAKSAVAKKSARPAPPPDEPEAELDPEAEPPAKGKAATSRQRRITARKPEADTLAPVRKRKPAPKPTPAAADDGEPEWTPSAKQGKAAAKSSPEGGPKKALTAEDLLNLEDLDEVIEEAPQDDDEDSFGDLDTVDELSLDGDEEPDDGGSGGDESVDLFDSDEAADLAIDLNEDDAEAKERVEQPTSDNDMKRADLFNLFVSRIPDAKRIEAAKVFVEEFGIAPDEAQDLVARSVIPLKKSASQQECQEMLDRLKPLRVSGRIAKVNL